MGAEFTEAKFSRSYFATRYPAWDIYGRSSTTSIIGAALIIIGGLLIMAPRLYSVYTNAEHTGKRKTISQATVGGFGLFALVAYGTFAAAQLTPGFSVVLRQIAFIAGAMSVNCFMYSLALLLPTNRNGLVAATAGAGGWLMASVLLIVFYPDTWYYHAEFGVLRSTWGAGVATLGTMLYIGSFISGVSSHYGGVKNISRLRWLFYLEEEGRLRTIFRLLIGMAFTLMANAVTGLVYLLILLPFGIDSSQLTPEIGASVEPFHMFNLAILTFGTYTVGASVASHVIDRRNPMRLFKGDSLAEDFDPRVFGVSMALGVFGVLLMMVAMAVSGTVEFSAGNLLTERSLGMGLLLAVGQFLLLGVWSTALVFAFAGWWVQNVYEGASGYIDHRPAAILATVTTGIAIAPFLLGKFAGNLPVFISFVVFMFSVGLIRISTGRITAAFAYFWGWMSSMLIIFGFRFDLKLATNLLSAEVTGPVFITGGDFGPVGGVFGLLTVLFVLILSMDFAIMFTDGDSTLQAEISPFSNSQDEGDTEA